MNLSQDGYVIDVPYPTFVHRQAMPLWMSMLIQQQGYQAPNIEQPFRFLDLGCAMGIHLHLTAAAHPNGHFVGVDINPQHLMVAEEGIRETKIQNLEFIKADFQSFLEQDHEPFDFIMTHGVWSWISKEQQDAIEKIVQKLLKPKGIFYCSYMSHPGADHFISIQKLMYEMSRNLQGDSISKASQTLNLTRRLGQSEMGLFEKIPTLNHDLATLAKDRPAYIAHDFLSEHWAPQHSADMLRRFGQLGLAYTAGAGVMENLDALTLKPEVKKMVDSLPLVTLKESVKDIARNTMQRQDLYVSQRQKMSSAQVDQFYHRQKMGLMATAPLDTDLALDPKLGKIHDVLPIFKKIIQLLKKKEFTIADLYGELVEPISIMQLSDILMVLVWAGYVHPIQSQRNDAQVARTNVWMQKQGLNWRIEPQFGTVIEL